MILPCGLCVYFSQHYILNIVTSANYKVSLIVRKVRYLCSGTWWRLDTGHQGQTRVGKRTVNSPVTASNPTWMVCSKSDGEEISGRSLSRSFFLPPAGSKVNSHQHITLQAIYQHGATGRTPAPFSGANIEMILFLDFFSSGTDGSGREL